MIEILVVFFENELDWFEVENEANIEMIGRRNQAPALAEQGKALRGEG